MKKLVLTVLALLLTLSLCCPSLAEEDITAHLKRIADPADNVQYTISTLEFGPLEPGDFPPDEYVSLLLDMKYEELDINEWPDGEYVVLHFPEENLYYYFSLTEDHMDLVLRTDGENPNALYRVTAPADRAPASGVMSAWYTSLADDQGLIAYDRIELPENAKGFEHDWFSDRVSLEIFPQDTDGFQVFITSPAGPNERDEWTYVCYYAPETNTLNADHVTREKEIFDETGAPERLETLYEKESTAVFSLPAENRLQISNSGEDELDTLTFEPLAVQDE